MQNAPDCQLLPGCDATPGTSNHPAGYGHRVGLSLDEIRAALDTLPSRRTPTASDWARLSASWRSKLDQRIAELQRLRDDLDNCIGCGCLSLKACSLYNPGDRAAELGAGPRYLWGDDKAGDVPQLTRCGASV